jgi:hypothetical protein
MWVFREGGEFNLKAFTQYVHKFSTPNMETNYPDFNTNNNISLFTFLSLIAGTMVTYHVKMR